MVTDRQRRSEALTKDEVKALTKYVASFPTKLDAADSMGLNRDVLRDIMTRGTGRYDSIAKIRQHINQSH